MKHLGRSTVSNFTGASEVPSGKYQNPYLANKSERDICSTFCLKCSEWYICCFTFSYLRGDVAQGHSILGKGDQRGLCNRLLHYSQEVVRPLCWECCKKRDACGLHNIVIEMPSNICKPISGLGSVKKEVCKLSLACDPFWYVMCKCTNPLANRRPHPHIQILRNTVFKTKN